MSDDWFDRHPFLAAPVALMLGFAIALPLALTVAAGFGLLLLGDELGLYDFDSGLGCENGDSVCR